MARTTRLFVSSLLLGGTLFAVTPAIAQPRDRAAAEALFRAGREAADKGDYATACKRFEESERLDPALGTLFNLADCKEKQGKLASAWQLFREVAQRLSDSDERAQIASERATSLEPRLPRLNLQLAPEAPAGTQVFRDGVELGAGSLSVPLPVDPGAHTVLVRAPGHQEKSYEVQAEEGKVVELAIAPGAATGAPSGETSSAGADGVVDIRTPPEPDRGTGGRKTAGYVIGGLGIASLVAGAVTGGLALSKKGEMEDNCASDLACNQDGVDAADSGKTFATISTITFAAGAVAVGVGAFLILSGDSEGKHVAVGAAPGTRGGSFVLKGNF